MTASLPNKSNDPWGFQWEGIAQLFPIRAELLDMKPAVFCFFNLVMTIVRSCQGQLGQLGRGLFGFRSI